MVYYAHKKSILKVEQMKEDFTLLTFAGEELGVAGDYVGTHENGDKEVIPKEVFEEEYSQVEVIKKGNIDLEKRKMFEDNAESMGHVAKVDSGYVRKKSMLFGNKAF